ncbi:hypothetical protein RJ641_036950 [Dillenia turbinata]|uniref:Replication factor C subunit 3 n=1 Tax=Dillenia turbinata TaxID=194707 RepID=A0AAN8VQ98_9MAGN
MSKRVLLPKRITRFRNTSRVPILWVPKKYISLRGRGELLQRLVFEIPPAGYVDVHYKDYCSIQGTTIVVHVYPKILNEVDVGDVQCTLIADQIRDKVEIRLRYADGRRVDCESDERTFPGGIRRERRKEFDLKGEGAGKILVNVKESSRHVEINISALKGYEKHVIVELVKERHTRISDKAVQCNHHTCRVIILYDADKLSTDALLYIKWLLERYKGCNKVLFCCNDASKIHAIKTLCTVIQLLPPPNHEIVQFLEFIAEKEGIELPREVAEKIADNNSFTRDQMIRTGWEEVIANIAKNIIQEQSPKQLYLIRGKLQTLIEHDVSPTFIADSLYAELKIHLKEQFQPQFVDLYKEFSGDEGRMLDSAKTFFLAPTRRKEQGKRINDPLKKNSYHFMRIEEFIAKFMSWYKVTVLNKRTIPQRVEA